VLFADLKGSMELLADRDPEEARKILDPVLEHISWRGVGVIVVGMERQGFRLSLKKYGNGAGRWVAQFNRDVMTSADGFGSGSTP
jgi:hypothetical protein